jgi:hypothetical protein
MRRFSVCSAYDDPTNHDGPAVDLTPARRKALEILDAHPDIPAGFFARRMWPHSKGHTTRSRRHGTPAGGAVGAGIAMTAGAFLGRMRRDGLVRVRSGATAAPLWNLTDKGYRALQAWRRSVRGEVDAERPEQREAALAAIRE